MDVKMPKQRGDTIIEVILAVTLFSLVAISAMTLMSHGTAIAQQSLEITQVRQQIDAQAEMLRYVHDRAKEDAMSPYATVWQAMSAKQVSTPYQFIGASACLADAGEYLHNRMFTLTPPSTLAGTITLNENFEVPATYATMNTDVTPARSEGLAVQLVRVQNGRAYDAYIQACWSSPGSSRPITLGTIVRLYDADI